MKDSNLHVYGEDVKGCTDAWVLRFRACKIRGKNLRSRGWDSGCSLEVEGFGVQV